MRLEKEICSRKKFKLRVCVCGFFFFFFFFFFLCVCVCVCVCVRESSIVINLNDRCFTSAKISLNVVGQSLSSLFASFLPSSLPPFLTTASPPFVFCHYVFFDGLGSVSDAGAEEVGGRKALLLC